MPYYGFLESPRERDRKRKQAAKKGSSLGPSHSVKISLDVGRLGARLWPGMEDREMTGELANQGLSNRFEGAIARSDKLMLLGDYEAALATLESLETDSPCTIEQNREVLRAKARTWVARGYPQRA